MLRFVNEYGFSGEAGGQSFQERGKAAEKAHSQPATSLGSTCNMHILRVA